MFLSSLMALAAVLIMGVISPGPSFIYVARNAVARSRTHGLVTALGTGAGAAIFSIMAMLGLQKVLTAVPEMFIGLKVACGEVIIYAWMDRRRENSEKPYGTRLGAGQAVSARLVGK